MLEFGTLELGTPGPKPRFRCPKRAQVVKRRLRSAQCRGSEPSWLASEWGKRLRIHWGLEDLPLALPASDAR